MLSPNIIPIFPHIYTARGPLKPLFLISFLFTILCILPSCRRYPETHTFKSLTDAAAPAHIIPPSTIIQKTIFVDQRFDDNERLSIMEATNDWERASNHMVRYNLEFDYAVDMTAIKHQITLVYLDPDDDLTEFLDTNNGGYFISGFMKKDDAEFIFIAPTRILDSRTFQLTLEHNLGRELGLMPLPETLPGVMNYIIPNGIECPTIYDMVSLCNAFACNVEETLPCKIKSN